MVSIVGLTSRSPEIIPGRGHGTGASGETPLRLDARNAEIRHSSREILVNHVRPATDGGILKSGYAAVNGLHMYYELHGSGGTPLVLLHGGLFDIDQQFGEVLPSLAATRRVIAADFQGHGRTNDIDRPLTSAGLASDVVGLLKHLQVEQADVFGFSVGGGVALHLAIRHPELVRKVIVSSASFSRDGDRPENSEAVGSMTVDMIAGTPMEQAYKDKSPHPDRLQGLLDKLGQFDQGFPGWSDEDIRGHRRPDPHHGRRLRRRQARARRPVPAAARRRRQRRLRRRPVLPARGVPGHHPLLRHGAHGAGARRRADLPGRADARGLTPSRRRSCRPAICQQQWRWITSPSRDAVSLGCDGRDPFSRRVSRSPACTRAAGPGGRPQNARQRVIATADAERRRIERDLHDGAQQRLVSVAVTLDSPRRRSDRGPACRTADRPSPRGDPAAIKELRELARGIHPAVLSDHGLKAALEALAARAPVPVEVSGVPAERLQPEVESAAYFVTAEALTNVAKYAQASEAKVRLSRERECLRVLVRDNGVGGADPSTGTGLRGLHDRVDALDGRLEVDSPPGGGTTVTVEIPLRGR